MRVGEIIGWILTGMMIQSIVTGYIERNTFLIHGGFSVYKCREITK